MSVLPQALPWPLGLRATPRTLVHVPSAERKKRLSLGRFTGDPTVGKGQRCNSNPGFLVRCFYFHPFIQLMCTEPPLRVRGCTAVIVVPALAGGPRREPGFIASMDTRAVQ